MAVKLRLARGGAKKRPYYYIVAARNEEIPFIRATVLGRHLVLVAFIVLVVMGHFRWQLLLFALPDQVGAVWTALALRKSAQPPAGPGPTS